jgi:hypothetical protein
LASLHQAQIRIRRNDGFEGEGQQAPRKTLLYGQFHVLKGRGFSRAARRAKKERGL